MSMRLPKSPGFNLTGKRALITGAGRGIGLAAAAGLAEYGAEVVLVARSADEIGAASDAINAAGGKATPQVLDVCDIHLTAKIIADVGPFDILLNNAGTNRPKPMSEVSEDDYDAVMDLNLRSSFFVTQAVAKGMITAKKGGSLIHMSSQMGQVGGVNRSLYCASKWGMEGMSKSFALDLAPHGIRSNTIAPTFIETPMTRPFFEDKAFLASVLDKIKLGRLGQVQDLMGAVIFLASNSSSMMTGTTVTVDGGWTAE